MDVTARFVELVDGPQAEIPLDEAALLIAAHAYPELDVEAELRALDGLAGGCTDRSLEGWRRHMFVELGFGGNAGDYYDPDNSFLNQVVHRRMGLPITLSVLGIELGRRLGVDLAGVGMPGHFLMRHDGGETAEPVYIDAFLGGALLDREGCVERFHEVNGPAARFDDSFLEPVDKLAILGRILANVKSVFAHRGDVGALRWVMTLRVALPATLPGERRELAQLLGAEGRFREAAVLLEEAAELAPDEYEALRAEAAGLLARLN